VTAPILGRKEDCIMNGEGSREKLVGDLKTLIGDAEELLRASANQAGEKISVARQKIEQSLIEGKKSLADAEKLLVQKGKEAADIADDYVRENPWGAVGIAAAVGLVLGLLMRRS
jgi:ElaB/YqjD/DUF883 family membrane-anchored ribosome-binding protein